jgi:hypothetical protein
MTDLKEARMSRLEDNGSNGRRVLWMMLAGLGTVMTLGAIAGFMGEHKSEGGGALSGPALAVLAVLGAIIAGLAYVIWRNAKKLKSNSEPMTKREKLNRNIILGLGLMGGVMGVIMSTTIMGNIPDGEPASLAAMFGSGPIPLSVVLPFVFVWGVIMPVIAWFWHTRAIDEQEASAYRDGGYYAAYAFVILTPLWWMLWRGGFLPEPDGIAIYLTFSVLWSAVWFWKKYR